jgi:hypothetical protein
MSRPSPVADSRTTAREDQPVSPGPCKATKGKSRSRYNLEDGSLTASQQPFNSSPHDVSALHGSVLENNDCAVRAQIPVLFGRPCRSQPARQLISIMFAHGVARPYGSSRSSSPNTPKRPIQTTHLLTRTITSGLAGVQDCQGLNMIASYAKRRGDFKQQSASSTRVRAYTPSDSEEAAVLVCG